MARILLLTPYLGWPPDHGGRIRSLNLFRDLSQEHEVLNISGRAPEDPADAQEHLEASGLEVRCAPLAPPHGRLPLRDRARKLLRVAMGRSSILPRFRNAELAALVREARAGADLAILDHVWMGAYLPELSDLPILFSSHNVESSFLEARARGQSGLDAWMTRREARALAQFEASLTRRAARTIVVSETDRGRLQALAPGAPEPALIPNGVDLATRPRLPWPEDSPPRLLYLGGYDYAPNLDAARRLAGEVLPRVRERLPDAEAVLVGRDPAGSLDELADLPGVRIAGRVEDVLDAWRPVHALVAPIHFGGGSRLKILEAFALGRPVITTALGAEGLPVRSGQELWLAETPDLMAQAVESVWRDAARRESVITRARDLVEASYDWPGLARNLTACAERVLSRGAPPRSS